MMLLKVVFASLLFTATAFAGETPATLEGATVVDAAKVKSLMDAGGVTVVDTRVATEYAEAHIKGAISIPYKEKSAKEVGYDAKMDSFDLGKLPTDKMAKIVMYCNAGECWKSYKSAKTAIQAGYKSIHWFRSGIPEWKEKKLPVE